ncbi:MAG: AI-2E family transporter [Gemmatimonadales bacterium]
MSEAPIPPASGSPTEEPPESRGLSTLFRRSIDIRSLGSSGLFLLGLLYTLRFARPFLVPVVLALLLSFLLRPSVRWLRRIRIPEAVGAALVLCILLGAAGTAIYQLSDPAANWVSKAPQSLRKIEAKVRRLRRPVEEVSKTAEQVERITDVSGGGDRTPEVQLKGPSLRDAVFGGTQTFLTGAAFVLILLYFLLASGDMFLRKLIKVLPRPEDRERAIQIARATQDQISNYLYTVTLIYAGLGVAVGMATWLLGVPNPMLWGVMAGMLCFVPYVGPLAGIAMLTLVSMLIFDDLGRALLVPGVYVALAVLEGSFVTPFILGRRLILNPVAVFLGLSFWWWMWGIPGAILAVPMMAVFKIVCDNSESLAPMGEFLGR